MLFDILNHDIHCPCGRTHRCDIANLEIGEHVLERLPDLLQEKNKILIVADRNTYGICGKEVCGLLEDKTDTCCVFDNEGLLVPNEESISYIEKHLNNETDFILGIGSGVINDLCKYVSFRNSLKCGIVATATSMDGYASSGAAMIIGGMKVTYTTHAPELILGDIDILKNAPIEMIRSGYADIIGKYSALCDWRLSELVNGEYLCEEIFSLVKTKTDEIRNNAKDIISREPKAIGLLMEALVLIGACLTLLSTTRPGSGSEHHMSHYFEITGLIENKPYFLHGTDVGYSTIVTSRLREEILTIKAPNFKSVPKPIREECYKAVYGGYWKEVSELQNTAKRYENVRSDFYKENWDAVLSILAECPSSDEIRKMLTDVGYDLNDFKKMYGKEKIRNGIWFAKDLKDRYSVLWLYYDLFFNEREAEKIARSRNI